MFSSITFKFDINFLMHLNQTKIFHRIEARVYQVEIHCSLVESKTYVKTVNGDGTLVEFQTKCRIHERVMLDPHKFFIENCHR